MSLATVTECTARAALSPTATCRQCLGNSARQLLMRTRHANIVTNEAEPCRGAIGMPPYLEPTAAE